jgi:N-acetylglucosamine-6-phosphate deacetylase
MSHFSDTSLGAGVNDAPSAIRGHVVTPTEVFEGEVVCQHGVIVEVNRCRVEAGAPLIVPGLIDLQINGSFGIDISSQPERTSEITAGLRTEGVGAFLPTVISCGPERRRHALEVLEVLVSDSTGPIGIHLEGPLLAPSQRGAHRAEFLESIDHCDTSRWRREFGVAMVTLAPELPGATALIRDLVESGVVVALGHTGADAATYETAIAAGARYATHLFNAMGSFHHRDPGPIGVVLADDVMTAGLIADGHHVDPRAVRLAWRALGPDRITLVTDAVTSRGQDDAAAVARLRDGTIAGGMVPLVQCLSNLIAWTGAALVDAVRTVTTTPADLLGRFDLGAIEVGRRADLCALDGGFKPVEFWSGGVSLAP